MQILFSSYTHSGCGCHLSPLLLYLFTVSANFVVALAIAGSHFSRIGLDPKKNIQTSRVRWPGAQCLMAFGQD